MTKHQRAIAPEDARVIETVAALISKETDNGTLTQSQIATLLGVSSSTLSNWLAKRRRIPGKYHERLAEILGVTRLAISRPEIIAELEALTTDAA
jgi:predicted transcriptional regulator